MQSRGVWPERRYDQFGANGQDGRAGERWGGAGDYDGYSNRGGAYSGGDNYRGVGGNDPSMICQTVDDYLGYGSGGAQRGDGAVGQQQQPREAVGGKGGAQPVQSQAVHSQRGRH